MLIKGSPDMLTPPRTPTLAVGGLGYVDSVTRRTQYTGAPTDWDIFRDQLFFGNRANRDDPAHFANIFGSYYDPRVWGGNVAESQRDLIAHWKRVLSGFAGATWNDLALAYAVPLSTIAQFAAAANATAFPIIRAVWQNPMLPDAIKRPALGLIVQTFGLTPWEWASVVGLDEATAAEVVNVPVPTVAATSLRRVVPAVQATASRPGYVVETRTGEVVLIPAGSEPFSDASFTNDASGRRVAVLTYSTRAGVELYFIDPNAPPLDRPIAPSKIARLRDLLGMVQRLVGERQRNITSDETPNFDRYLNAAAALVIDLGLTETELAQALGLTLEQFRAIYVFDAAGFGIVETREVVTFESELPALTAPSAQALEPVKQVFYFQFPAGFSSLGAEEKARFYLSVIAQGFTDAQIRITAESTFGPQSDSDWFALQQIAAALYAADVAAASAAAAAAAAAVAQTVTSQAAAEASAQAAVVAEAAAASASTAVTVEQVVEAAAAATDAATVAEVAAQSAEAEVQTATVDEIPGPATTMPLTVPETVTTVADRSANTAEVPTTAGGGGLLIAAVAAAAALLG